MRHSKPGSKSITVPTYSIISAGSVANCLTDALPYCKGKSSVSPPRNRAQRPTDKEIFRNTCLLRQDGPSRTTNRHLCWQKSMSALEKMGRLAICCCRGFSRKLRGPSGLAKPQQQETERSPRMERSSIGYARTLGRNRSVRQRWICVRRVYVRPNSLAEAKRQPGAQVSRTTTTHSPASGFVPAPERDLISRSEQTVAHFKYPNRFVGVKACRRQDRADSINSARAKSDRGLNGFARRYFPAGRHGPSCPVASSGAGLHRLLFETSVKSTVPALAPARQFSGHVFATSYRRLLAGPRSSGPAGRKLLFRARLERVVLDSDRRDSSVANRSNCSQSVRNGPVAAGFRAAQRHDPCTLTADTAERQSPVLGPT